MGFAPADEDGDDDVDDDDVARYDGDSDEDEDDGDDDDDVIHLESGCPRYSRHRDIICIFCQNLG